MDGILNSSKNKSGLQQDYTELELVKLLQVKDQRAFSYLYDNYAAALHGIIFRLVQDRSLAEDILQEVFIKIWNNFSSYDRSKGRLFTWLINLTRNFTIDTLRSKEYKKQAKISGDENSVDSLYDTHSGPDRFDTIGIRKQLSTLKNDHRLIIELSYFHGLTQNDISKELGIPLGTVKTRLRTAILELRKIFQP